MRISHSMLMANSYYMLPKWLLGVTCHFSLTLALDACSFTNRFRKLQKSEINHFATTQYQSLSFAALFL